MAYCDRCGSYIPDGWTTCPACGYNKEQETKQNQQAAAAQAKMDQQAAAEKARKEEAAAKAREEAERRRAERQAYDKTWAENEQRRRREEEELRRRQQEQEDRNRQEQEKLRREQEKLRREQYTGGVHVYTDPDGTKNVHVGDRVHVVVNPDGSKKVQVGDVVRDFVNSDAVNQVEETVTSVGGKLLPVLSYIGPLCFLSLILGNNSFTKFHAKQGLRLFIWSVILEAVGGIFSIGWAVGIFQIVMAIIGIKNAVNGEEKKLPYIGG